MRIAISGTANTGKSTLVKDFLKRWPNFETTKGTYTQFLKEDNHSSKTNTETQESILNWLVDRLQQYGPEDNVIFDRCPLDNLIYTLWGVVNGSIEGSFADKCIPIVRESLRNLDIIFYIPFDENIPIVDDGTREANEAYIRDIDMFFQVMYEDYVKADESTYVIFPKDDMPALIPISGTREQRLACIADYIDIDGDIKDTNPEESVLSEEQLQLMEGLLKTQEGIVREDKFKI